MQNEFIFGLNAEKVGLAGMLLCTIIEVLGLCLQIRTMWRNRSGRSLSVWMVSYQFVFLLIGAMYGVSLGNAVICINFFALAAFVFVILWGLRKFKGFTSMQNGFLLFLALAVLIVFAVPFKNLAFLIASGISVVTFLAQPLEIWRNKDSGVVEIQLLIVLFISSCFWTLYAYAADNSVLKITSPSFLAVVGLTMIVWAWYRNPKYRKA